jgi:hypothetical protein
VVAPQEKPVAAEDKATEQKRQTSELAKKRREEKQKNKEKQHKADYGKRDKEHQQQRGDQVEEQIQGEGEGGGGEEVPVRAILKFRISENRQPQWLTEYLPLNLF